MRFLLAALLALSAAASAQTFPGPGEGAYTWERVGNAQLGAKGLFWPSVGELTAVGPEGLSRLTGDGPAGTWTTTQTTHWAKGVIVLRDGVTLAGDGVIDRSSNGLPPWTRGCGFNVNNGECYGPEGANAFLELPPGHAHAGRVLAGNHNYSDDRGLTWTVAPYTAYPTEALTISDFALLPSGRVLASANGWGFVSSDDGGASWQATPVYAPYRYSGYGITALATPGSIQSGNPSCVLPNPALCEGALAIGTDAQDAFNRTWWTNDGGRSWRQGQPLRQVYDGVAWGFVGGVFDLGLDPGTGLGRSIAVLGRGFVFATRDGGQTWSTVARMPILPPDDDVKSVRSAVLGPDGRLYASVMFGGPQREWVYRTREPLTAAFAVAGEAGPEMSSLGVSVWPNPAGGRVAVGLTLAEAGPVRVVVVDALGRRVAVLHDGPLGAGAQTVAADAAGWPPGVYAVRVEASGRVASARLVVVR